MTHLEGMIYYLQRDHIDSIKHMEIQGNLILIELTWMMNSKEEVLKELPKKIKEIKRCLRKYDIEIIPKPFARKFLDSYHGNQVFWSSLLYIKEVTE